ncbi:MAG: cell division protein FtsQ/DivIB [Terricaulis sp.]
MAAMRARRPGRDGNDRPTKGRGRRTPPPPPQAMPRLAQIKLNGFGETEGVSGRSLMLGLTGAVLFLGAAIAGATWIGGSLFDARAAFARSADGAVASLGFGIDRVDVSGEGVGAARIAEVRSVIVPEGGQSLLSLDPEAVKARIEGLDWVDEANVRRLWPSTLRVEVKRREAYARWQEDGVISVIDMNGERLLADRAADYTHLPLIVGRGAGPAAEPLLIALEELPQVRAHLRALVRVGERRWNMELTSGATARLPEASPAFALAQLEQLQSEHRLLDRPVAELDLRAPGRLAVRVHPQLAGGPVALAGGV